MIRAPQRRGDQINIRHRSGSPAGSAPSDAVAAAIDRPASTENLGLGHTWVTADPEHCTAAQLRLGAPANYHAPARQNGRAGAARTAIPTSQDWRQIDLVAAGLSAQVQARLPLRWTWNP
jgi:hypothetical protein